MQVILLEKVHNLGNLGDKVKVRPGYGRNFLIPYGKAVFATPVNLKAFEERRADLELKAKEALATAQARSEALAALEPVAIFAKASDEGKLYGSVGAREIADAVTAAGIELERREVLLPHGPYRQVGEFSVSLQLHGDVVGAVNIRISPAA